MESRNVLKAFLVVLGIFLFILAMAELSTLLPFTLVWVLWLLLGLLGVFGAFYLLPGPEDEKNGK